MINIYACSLKQSVEAWMNNLHILLDQIDDDFDAQAEDKEALFNAMDQVGKELIFMYGSQELLKKEGIG